MRKSIFLYVAMFMLGVFQPAYAQDIAEQPCDTKFWKQMSSRAWLEAEREIMQNQNLIFKPDTVLAYTCFDEFVDVAAWPGGEIFVHTDYFQKKPIERGFKTKEHKVGAMEESLKVVVAATAKTYFESNYQHPYLGGRGDKLSTKVAQYKGLDGEVRDDAYGCNEMANVWQTAKCANFIDNEEFELTDGFYPFTELKGHNGGPTVKGYTEINDTRKFPSPCSGPTGRGPNNQNALSQSQGSGDWESQHKIATNEGDDVYPFATPLNEIFKDVGDKLRPGNCGPSIPTGVMVYVKEKAQHMDGACTNPGCTYSADSSGRSGSSCL